MTPAPQVAVAVLEPSQVGEARRVAMRLAESLAFDEQARAEVGIVATELATNLARYATRGSLLIQTIDLPGGPAVELLSVDAGPGMADVTACLQDGYSTGGTPGNGLGAVRRLSHDFDIFSSPAGTVVLARIRRAGAAAAVPPSAFTWGAVSLPAPHETVCGDAWRFAHQGSSCAVLVTDGLGHGPHAADAAQRAVRVFDERPFDEPTALLDRAHRALGGSRGAAVAVATLGGSSLRYAGVGNIAGVLAGGERARGLTSQNGTVGVQLRKLQAFDFDWPANGRLVMHSDGLTNRWSLDSYPGLALRHPAIAAGVLWRDCVRGRDDATIVVVARRTAGTGHA